MITIYYLKMSDNEDKIENKETNYYTAPVLIDHIADGDKELFSSSTNNIFRTIKKVSSAHEDKAYQKALRVVEEGEPAKGTELYTFYKSQKKECKYESVRLLFEKHFGNNWDK
jgi:hypothetical protein